MAYARQRRDQQRFSTILTFAIPALLVAAGLCAVLWRLLGGSLYPKWLVAASIVSCAMFRFDKGQAQRSGPRVPEVVLHLLTLLGGFVGSALGMFGFRRRHKVNDLSFWAVLLASAAAHLILIYLWFLR